jgi:hypothetical protein
MGQRWYCCTAGPSLRGCGVTCCRRSPRARTVAEEYFKVSEQVEALYDQPKALPATAEGAEMRKLRSEMHRRMLGNDYCARPVGLDCHFESICESCTYFQTTLEFRPTLQRQRNNAADKGQIARLKIFDGLLTRLDEQAS